MEATLQNCHSVLVAGSTQVEGHLSDAFLNPNTEQVYQGTGWSVQERDLIGEEVKWLHFSEDSSMQVEPIAFIQKNEVK